MNLDDSPNDTITCSTCKMQFKSRNKLFMHIKVAKCTLDKGRASKDSSGLVLYVIGGRHRNKTLGSTEYFIFDQESWNVGPDLLEHRGSHGATTAQDYSTIYTLSGGGMHGNLSSCEKLNLDSNDNGSWSFTAPMGSDVPKHALAVCSFEDTESSFIYAIGGWADGKRCSNDFEVYNVKSDVWELLPPFTISRRLLGAVATKRFVYTFGGCIDNSNHLGFVDDESLARSGWVTGAVERYDVESQSWESLRHMPMAGPASAVQVEDDIFVIIHGRALLQYDPYEDKYIRICSLPLQEWYCFDCCSYGSKIYITGGSVRGRWSTAFFAFDRRTLEWTQLPDMMRERRRAACAIIKRKTV